MGLRAFGWQFNLGFRENPEAAAGTAIATITGVVSGVGYCQPRAALKLKRTHVLPVGGGNAGQRDDGCGEPAGGDKEQPRFVAGVVVQPDAARVLRAERHSAGFVDVPVIDAEQFLSGFGGFIGDGGYAVKECG